MKGEKTERGGRREVGGRVGSKASGVGREGQEWDIRGSSVGWKGVETRGIEIGHDSRSEM